MATTASRGRWVMARHLAQLDEAIWKLVTRQIPERVLVIRMPPRHGKSELVSHWTPAWFEANFPDKNTLLTSYEATFAAGWGRKARDTFVEVTKSAPEFLLGRLKDDRTAADNWGTTAGGYMATAGVGGGVTGKGFHLGVCDDLIKNAEQAQSETYREKTWTWLTSTFWSRREPEGVMIVVGTPWHREDYLARLRNWDEPIKEICLPAVCENEGDPLDRQIGEVLWPERFDEVEMQAIKLAQGPYYWSALYQGRPSLHEHAEWSDSYFGDDLGFTEWPHESEINCKVMTLDPSLGRTDESDYSAFVMLVVDKDGVIYVDADIRRRDVSGMVEDGLSMYRTFQPDCWGLEVNGFAALEDLIYVKAMPVMPRLACVTQHANKLARIRLGVGPQLAARRIRFRRTPGVALLVNQLKDFPLAEHDDGPDALELAIRIAGTILDGGMDLDDAPQRVYA